jgi:hypothetical protein
MLEMTYTLKLGQLLMITLDHKKYMWQKIKPKKQILEPSVAIVAKTHSKLNTIVIKLNN